jgi:Zn-dependent M28 family amino/carboxypeptidase
MFHILYITVNHKARIMKKLYTLIPCLCFLAMCTTAQDIKEKEVTRIISTLAADDMQGRKTFTPGAEKAATFIEQEFAKAKLQPVPGNKGFRQVFAHYEVKPGLQQLSLNGQTQPAVDRLLVLGAAEQVQWNQDSSLEKIQIKNNDNFYEQLEKLLRGAKRNTIVWVDSAHNKEFISYNRGIQETGRHLTDSGKMVVMILKTAADTAVKTWEIKATQHVTPLPLFNIIGMIRGTTKPDEYVIFSAHYDHLGIQVPEAGDSIANGADDDASGVTAIISMANYYKKQPAPARTILFIAFTGEEIGEHGSHYYAAHTNPDKIVAMFNIDMLGKVSKFGKNSVFVTGYERSDFGEILKRNLKNSPFRVYPDPYPDQHLFYRADNAALAKLGVPAHTISTARIDIDTLYHNVRDEVKTLDLNNLTNVIKGIITSARSIINGTDTPKRVDKKKV